MSLFTKIVTTLLPELLPPENSWTTDEDYSSDGENLSSSFEVLDDLMERGTYVSRYPIWNGQNRFSGRWVSFENAKIALEKLENLPIRGILGRNLTKRDLDYLTSAQQILTDLASNCLDVAGCSRLRFFSSGTFVSISEALLSQMWATLIHLRLSYDHWEKSEQFSIENVWRLQKLVNALCEQFNNFRYYLVQNTFTRKKFETQLHFFPDVPTYVFPSVAQSPFGLPSANFLTNPRFDEEPRISHRSSGVESMEVDEVDGPNEEKPHHQKNEVEQREQETAQEPNDENTANARSVKDLYDLAEQSEGLNETSEREREEHDAQRHCASLKSVKGVKTMRKFLRSRSVGMT